MPRCLALFPDVDLDLSNNSSLVPGPTCTVLMTVEEYTQDSDISALSLASHDNRFENLEIKATYLSSTAC
jgi:hypothetical protein